MILMVKDQLGDAGGAPKGEETCRICHLKTGYFSQAGSLIQLGCRCRNSLGRAHRSCAQHWFATKGNRFCEICGAVAINVPGVAGTNGSILELNRAPSTSDWYTPTMERWVLIVCGSLATLVMIAFVIYKLFFEK